MTKNLFPRCDDSNFSTRVIKRFSLYFNMNEIQSRNLMDELVFTFYFSDRNTSADKT